MKDNKAKIAAAEQGKVIDGTVYTIIFEVSSGQYKGRLFFMGLNLAHTSAQTVDIANRELGGIVRSCGKSTLKDDDLDDLIDDELVVTVAVVPATAQYPASNKIKSSKPLKGVAKPTPSAAENPKKKWNKRNSRR